ncbi:calpain-A-like isoform X2 [Neocloeon triangulifer]|uniref:calpain-A-like isoform X2 n=1 Tax=Neocloeon triangulifer TaxID=2078957 RepID=UPI00286EB895|nr:calpain-A-like isoform X2 [Neocloeon triangulifer]
MEIVKYRSYERVVYTAGICGTGKIGCKVQVFEEIQRENLALPYFFDDKEFHAEDLHCLGPHIGNVFLKHAVMIDPEMRLRGAKPNEFDRDHFAQGFVGNCWLLSALAAVVSDTETMKTIFPDSNAEIGSDLHTGALKIRVCVEGTWEAGVVDTKVLRAGEDFVGCQPVLKAENLILWPLMIEKYLFKRYGLCLLDGGYMCEGFTLLTEGTTITLRTFESCPIKLLELMQHMFEHNGFVCAATENAVEGSNSTSQLTAGHAYSVLGVYFVEVQPTSEMRDNGFKEILIKLRDPWADREPKYPWSKKSDPLWKRVSDAEKQEIGYCELGNATPGIYNRYDGLTSQVFMLNSLWEPEYSAGGDRRFETYSTNPRLYFTVPKNENGSTSCTWVRLIQQGQRECSNNDPNYYQFCYGFDIFHVGSDNTIVNSNWLQNNNPVFSTIPDFLSQTSAMVELKPGYYLVIPYTETPESKAYQFSLKVVVESDKCLSCTKLDEEYWEWIEDRVSMYEKSSKADEHKELGKSDQRRAHDELLRARRKRWV